MYIVIYGWVGAGLSDCRLLAIMVGKTRPYKHHVHCNLWLGGGGFTRLSIIGNYGW